MWNCVWVSGWQHTPDMAHTHRVATARAQGLFQKICSSEFPLMMYFFSLWNCSISVLSALTAHVEKIPGHPRFFFPYFMFQSHFILNSVDAFTQSPKMTKETMCKYFANFLKINTQRVLDFTLSDSLSNVLSIVPKAISAAHIWSFTLEFSLLDVAGCCQKALERLSDVK